MHVNVRGCSTWKLSCCFEAAYVKCVKSFFGFERRYGYSVTQMFCDLGLPTSNTVIHNAQVRFHSSIVYSVYDIMRNKWTNQVNLNKLRFNLMLGMKWLWFVPNLLQSDQYLSTYTPQNKVATLFWPTL